MAKKTRKPNLPQSTLERARRELYGNQVPEAQPETPVAVEEMPVPAPRKTVPRQVNLREEYAYVINDLQNMGILAAAMMIVLVVMSLFI